jgi:hypothetical protein
LPLIPASKLVKPVTLRRGRVLVEKSEFSPLVENQLFAISLFEFMGVPLMPRSGHALTDEENRISPLVAKSPFLHQLYAVKFLTSAPATPTLKKHGLEPG